METHKILVRQREHQMSGQVEQPSGTENAPRHDATHCVQTWHDSRRRSSLPWPSVTVGILALHSETEASAP